MKTRNRIVLPIQWNIWLAGIVEINQRLLTISMLIGILFGTVTFAQTANGDLQDYMDNIIDNVPGNSGDDYVIPNSAQINSWNQTIGFLLDNNLEEGRTIANDINYQITEFTDTSINPNQIFYVLEEKASAQYYWGTYVFTKNPVRNNLILMAPHSIYDTNTGKQAVFCFKNNLARVVMINGTHRCNSDAYSSCSGTTGVCGISGDNYKMSDLAHTEKSMFHETTETLFSDIARSVFIQLHGFGKRDSDPYVIMSNGTRETPSTDYAAMIRDALFVEDGSLTFKLAHIDTDWTRLIGFTNTQGRFINNSSDPCDDEATNSSGRFIHIEQERTKLRKDDTVWVKMSNALSNVFESTLGVDDVSLTDLVQIYPNPTEGNIEFLGVSIEQIEVFNMVGQQVIMYKSNLKNLRSVDLKTLQKGVYQIKIKSGDHFINKKVIKI